jgi:peroxin-5
MSFLGGPECSTAANPLAQFSKQTSTDTSLQRDRLTSRQNLNPAGFRSGQQLPEDAAFQEFAQQQGPARLGDMLPNEAFHLEQLRREAEHIERAGSRGSGGGWASEFSQQGPQFAGDQFGPQQFNGSAGFSPQDFASFRQSQMSPAAQHRTQSPAAFQQSMYQRPSMYGGGFGMQRPMMFQSAFAQQQQQPEQQYEGKGKGRVQELSDTDWEKQFEELSTVEKDAHLEQLDRDAQESIERELNQTDR